ncbi:Fc.00g039290.m01.CDS01 [Cosmosporella sp. VM-42]
MAFTNSLIDKQIDRLKDLHEEAKRLEDDYKSSSRIYRLLVEHQKRVTDVMSSMASEMSEMRQDIRVLTEAVRRLSEAQKSPRVAIGRAR